MWREIRLINSIDKNKLEIVTAGNSETQEASLCKYCKQTGPEPAHWNLEASESYLTHHFNFLEITKCERSLVEKYLTSVITDQYLHLPTLYFKCKYLNASS